MPYFTCKIFCCFPFPRFVTRRICSYITPSLPFRFAHLPPLPPPQKKTPCFCKLLILHPRCPTPSIGTLSPSSSTLWVTTETALYRLTSVSVHIHVRIHLLSDITAVSSPILSLLSVCTKGMSNFRPWPLLISHPGFFLSHPGSLSL